MRLLSNRENIQYHYSNNTNKYNDVLLNKLEKCTISLNDFYDSNFTNSDLAISSYSILGIIIT